MLNCREIAEIKATIIIAVMKMRNYKANTSNYRPLVRCVIVYISYCCPEVLPQARLLLY
jgi:hypothetical protein